MPAADLTVPALTVPALIATRRRHDPAVQALVSDDEAITYAELDDASRTLAACLVGAGAGAGVGAGVGAGAGVGKGNRVGLAMPNGIDWAVAALAVMRVGGVLVPLSTLLKPPELQAQLRTAAVTHLIVARRFRGRSYVDDLNSVAPGAVELVRHGEGHAALPSLRSIWTWGELPTSPAPGPVIEGLESVVRPADDMVVLFTSGSSGGPKGVIHTHGNALRAVASGLDVRCVRPGERLYIPMPLFWTGGFAGGLMSALVAGATLLTEAEPEPGRTVEFLERERVTLFRGWPDQAVRIAAHPAFATADLSSLRPGSLGAVLPPKAQPAPGARANLFGMTETFGPYCGWPLDVDLPTDKYGSCGQPFPGVEVRVVDPDTGVGVRPGAAGEIHLRGPNLMRGICGRAASEVFGADGFYATADLGVLDEDGYLWYRGRLDDMFKVKGATVYPMEVETALRGLPGISGISGISGAFVTSVVDDEGTRQVAALVVADSPGDQDDLVECARSQLSSFKIPTRWLVVSDPQAVPRLASGKVDVNALRQLLQEAGVMKPGKARTM